MILVFLKDLPRTKLLYKGYSSRIDRRFEAPITAAMAISVEGPPGPGVSLLT